MLSLFITVATNSLREYERVAIMEGCDYGGWLYETVAIMEGCNYGGWVYDCITVVKRGTTEFILS